MKLNTFNDNLRKNILQSRVGLELETLRVTSTGEMAKTPPRYREGEDKTRDFAENQLEINTPVFLHQDEARAYLANALYRSDRCIPCGGWFILGLHCRRDYWILWYGIHP